MLVHLPPGLVELLNALYWGQEDVESELQAFAETWRDIEGWHKFHGSYCVNEKEEGDLENTLTPGQTRRLLGVTTPQVRIAVARALQAYQDTGEDPTTE